MSPQFFEDPNFARPGGTPFNQKLLADCIWHRGILKLLRVKIIGGAATIEDLPFNGLATMAADFAPHQITVGTDANGTPTLASTDTSNGVWLISWQSNLLKSSTYAPPGHVVPSAVALSAMPIALENKIWEAGAQAGQDILGYNPRTLSDTPTYRVLNHATNSAANTRSYFNPAGVSVQVTGDPIVTLSEIFTLPTAVQNLASLKVLVVLSVAPFTQLPNPDLYNAKLRLTWEGLVLTFEERLSAATLPDFTTLNSTSYINRFGNRFYYDPALDCFVLKHAIRLRGHGWGDSSAGKRRAGFFTPRRGRFICADYIEEQLSTDGQDFRLPQHPFNETGVKLLRQVDRFGGTDANGIRVHELDTKGGRFFTPGAPTPLDGLVAFDQVKDNPAAVAAMIAQLAAPDAQPPLSGPRNLGASLTLLPLAVEHINGLIQLCNQIKSVRPLSLSALRIQAGNRTLIFDPDWSVPIGQIGLDLPLQRWSKAFVNYPAPTDAQFSPGDNTYWPWWLAAKGIPLKTISDYPEVANFAAQWNEKRTASCMATSHLSNASYGGAFQYYDNSGASRAFNFITADVSMTVGEWSFGPVTNFSQGIAEYRIAGGDQVQTINLATGYTGLKWITSTEAAALAGTLGFPSAVTDLFQPVILEKLRSSTTFEHSAQVDSIFAQFQNARVCGYDVGTWPIAAGAEYSTAPDWPYLGDGGNGYRPSYLTALAHIQALNARPVDNLTINSAPVVTAQMVFRMAESGEAPTYKVPLAPTLAPLVFNVTASRSLGRSNNSFLATAGWRTSMGNLNFSYVVPLFAGSVQYRMTDGGLTQPGAASPAPTANPAMITKFNTTGAYGLSGFLFSVVQVGFNRPAPFDLATAANTINNLGPDYPIDQTHETVAQVGSQSLSPHHLVISAANLAVPADVPSRLSAERLAAHQNNERFWCAANIVGPTGGLAVYAAPVSGWGSQLDWWLTDRDHWLQNVLDYDANGHPSPQDAPPRFIAAQRSGQALSPGVGLTVLQPPPDAFQRLVYAPLNTVPAP